MSNMMETLITCEFQHVCLTIRRCALFLLLISFFFWSFPRPVVQNREMTDFKQLTWTETKSESPTEISSIHTVTAVEALRIAYL